jgi:hypothetical protein
LKNKKRTERTANRADQKLSFGGSDVGQFIFLHFVSVYNSIKPVNGWMRIKIVSLFRLINNKWSHVNCFWFSVTVSTSSVCFGIV